MDDRAYWIWLQQAFGEGSPWPWHLYNRFSGGVQEFYQGGPRLWNSLAFITDQQAEALYGFSLEEAQARLEYAQRVGWQVITPECEKYPGPLRNISDPPAVLYVKGTLPNFDGQPSIAVAGARKALEVSLAAAEKIGYQLAAGGAPVVSGGAVGIDSAALSGAMSALGCAVSVLPVDLGSPYLGKNASLRRRVCERGGALISEYFMQRNPAMGGFQVRNRLITGLSCGVVLIQCKEKSGTMIYARHALDQNRDVFVYPGPPGAPEYAGSQALLQDGAKAVTCGEDVLEEYVLRFSWPGRAEPILPVYEGLFDNIPLPPKKKEPVGALADPGQPDSAPCQRLLEALGTELLPLGELEQRTGLPVSKLLGMLTELELDGQVVSAPGKRYRRV